MKAFLGIRIDAATLAQVDSIAKLERRTRSDAVRLLIEDAVAAKIGSKAEARKTEAPK